MNFFSFKMGYNCSKTLTKFATWFFVLAFYKTLSGWALTPTIATIDPEKGQVLFTLTAEKNDKQSAIEIYVAPRIIDELGEETLGEKSKDFFVYPSKISLKPGQERTIRVVWKGDRRDFKVEKAFRIIAGNLPVVLTPPSDLDNGEVGINISLCTQYLNSLYVTPKDAKPDIKSSKTYFQENSSGSRDLVIELVNEGNAHQYMIDFSLSVAVDGKNLKLSKECVKKFYSTGINILAGQRRIIKIPEEALSTEAVSSN